MFSQQQKHDIKKAQKH